MGSCCVTGCHGHIPSLLFPPSDVSASQLDTDNNDSISYFPRRPIPIPGAASAIMDALGSPSSATSGPPR